MREVKTALGEQFELVNDLLTECDRRNTEQVHLLESLSKIHRDHYKECAGTSRDIPPFLCVTFFISQLLNHVTFISITQYLLQYTSQFFFIAVGIFHGYFQLFIIISTEILFVCNFRT